MANTDSNTNIYSDPFQASDIHYSAMAGALVNLSFDDMDQDECLLLAHCCDESRAGLCHCIAVLGDLLKEGDMTHVSLCRLQHTLITLSQLIPAMTDLSQFLHADLRNRKTFVS